MNKSAYAGITVTLVIHLGLVGGVAAFTSWGGDDDDEDKDKKFFAIEAALAYKSDVETDQPQKPTRKARKTRAPQPPDPVPKPVPDKAEPDQPKEPDKQKQEDFSDDFQKYFDQRQTDSDDESSLDDENLEEGAEDVAPAGQFDGSKHGFAEVSRGDPYMQKLAAEVYEGWELTTLEKGVGAAVGCLRLAADGSIVATELWQPTKNANIDLSVKNALAAVQKKRKPGESPVPIHLMDATTQWTCFRFSVDGP